MEAEAIINAVLDFDREKTAQLVQAHLEQGADALAILDQALIADVRAKGGSSLKTLVGGGYVPLADGRVRADVPFENYVYYRQLLEKVTRA